MKHYFHLFAVFLTLCASLLTSGVAVASSHSSSEQRATPRQNLSTTANAADNLSKMQMILDKIKNQVSNSPNDGTLLELNQMAAELSDNAQTLSQSLKSQKQQTDAQLAVLGAEPDPKNANKETSEIRHKRRLLLGQQTNLSLQLQQTEDLSHGAQILSNQIQNLRRDQLKTQLALNSGSLFSAKFWQPVTDSQQDADKISEFIQQITHTLALSWQSGLRLATLLWLAASLLIMILGRRYTEQFWVWLTLNKLPDAHLRRSFLATAVTLTTFFAVVSAFYCFAQALLRQEDTTAEVQEWIERLVRLSILAGLIAGLGRAFLSTRRPSWRLAGIPDEIALALKQAPAILAALAFLFPALEAFNYTVATHISTTLFANGLTALLIGLFSVSVIVRVQLVRKYLRQSGKVIIPHAPLAMLIETAVMLCGMTILISLLVGYVAFARFLSYELIWCAILFSGYYLLSHLVRDSAQTLFSESVLSGLFFINTFKLSSKHLQQIASLLNACLQAALVVMLVLLLFTGTISSSSPAEVIVKAIAVLGGKGLEKFHIVPSHLLLAMLTFGCGIWILKVTRLWLENDFLPKTSMDSGMQVSVITLFSNVGYVLILLITLSLLGLQWDKLAWIVSALSVGIGFGLQEIVKNFISGLILLTERPVKVGDLVSLSGIEGDIKRIKVRATEIQLADKSTVIVPNSQLISQNVRNATMNNAQGVVTIPMTFPLDVDVRQVKTILLQVFADNERIMDNPPPSVSFKELSAEGIQLSITGNVISQRVISSVKSDLLFELLVQLRENKIHLSEPQTMVIERKSKHHSSDRLADLHPEAK